MPQDGALHRLGEAAGRKEPYPFGGMSFDRRVLLIGEALVIEIVEQAYQPPFLRIFPHALSHGPHRDLDGIHVLPKSFGGCVFVHERQSAVAGPGHDVR
jgi:hypothetical protein